MRKDLNHHSGATSKIMMPLAVLCLAFVLGCSQEKENGTVLILELENSENVRQYWVFNPYIKTIDKCEAAADQAIKHVLASTAVPKDSRVTSWRCSFKPPDRGG
jgi:hypothetical protein